MTKVKISHVFNATADHLWSLIGNPGDIADWHPAIASSPMADGKRTCSLTDGGEVKEEIVTHDDSMRSYTYRITSSPLPLSDYISTISVEPLSTGRAEVTWEGQCEPEGIESAQLEAMLSGLYSAGLEALEAKI